MDGVQGPNFISRKDPAFRDLTGAVEGTLQIESYAWMVLAQ